MNNTYYSVVEWSPMCLFTLFQLFSNEWLSYEYIYFKWCVCWKRRFMKIYVLFCLCYPILLNNVLYDMIFIINAYAIFDMYYWDIGEIEFGTFLGCISKKGIKLLSQYLKEEPVLCSHTDVIYLYSNNRLILLAIPIEYRTVIGTPYHFYRGEDIFN